MPIVPFPPRVPAPARTLEQLVDRKRSPHPSCDIAVEKEARTRRYVLWSDAPGRFVGEIWYGRAQHLRKRVAGVHDARMLAQSFAREIRDLLVDGWAAQDAAAQDAIAERP